MFDKLNERNTTKISRKLTDLGYVCEIEKLSQEVTHENWRMIVVMWLDIDRETSRSNKSRRHLISAVIPNTFYFSLSCKS